MAEDDLSFRVFQHREHHTLADVRNVNYDAEAVHLRDNSLAPFGQVSLHSSRIVVDR